MEKEFVPYELAVKMKELGFDGKCFGWYTVMENIVFKEGVELQDLREENTLAPLWQQAFDWFREKYNLTSMVYQVDDINSAFEIFEINFATKGKTAEFYEIYKETYEQSRHACLEKLIQLIQNKNDRSI